MFVIPQRAAGLLEEAIAGIARGLEIFEVVRLDPARRDAVVAHLGRGRTSHVPAGAPHTLVVACDVAPPPGITARVRPTEVRLADVADYTVKRLLRNVPAAQRYEAVRHTATPEQAMDLLAVLGDPGLPSRLLRQVGELGRACAFPYPVVEMLGGDSPGFRARVAVVAHPVHGRTVCKIFRPGATAYFRRELHARFALSDQPLVPALLEHGDNWLLTPEYGDDGRHRLRALPGLPGMDQLRPQAVRALAELAVVMHRRGLFMLDLSPQNLMSDPRAGLKVLDLEFVMPYADFPGPAPAIDAAWSFRGVPAPLRSIDLPSLALTRGVGNSVFHPAVAGLPVERLLGAPRPGDGPRRVLTQLRWWATMATAGRVHGVLKGGRP